MALVELQIAGYPKIHQPAGEWSETRVFRTTTEADFTNLFGTIAAAPFTQRATPLYYRDVSAERGVLRDTANSLLVWRVEITAAPLSSLLNVNPSQSELEEVEIDSLPQFDSDGTLNHLEVETRNTIIPIVTQSDINKVRDERLKIGKVNNAANVPFTGAVLGEWKCSTVKSNRIGSTLSKLQIVYVYERAPRDTSGSQQTWTAWGLAQNPAITYATGNISPLRL